MTIVEKLTIIELADGTRIEGMVPIGDRPREQSRISDVLNDAHGEFRAHRRRMRRRTT